MFFIYRFYVHYPFFLSMTKAVQITAENIIAKTFNYQVSDWNTFNVTWTCVSAVSSMVSLGWGVAAYSQALRMVREDKGKLSWMGMVLQTVWRFSMMSARIVALVLISLTLHRWVFIVLGKNNFKEKLFSVFTRFDRSPDKLRSFASYLIKICYIYNSIRTKRNLRIYYFWMF